MMMMSSQPSYLIDLISFDNCGKLSAAERVREFRVGVVHVCSDRIS